VVVLQLDSPASGVQTRRGPVRAAVVTAAGSTLQDGAANFYVLHDDPAKMSEDGDQAFLGMSIQCAKCHNHPDGEVDEAAKYYRDGQHLRAGADEKRADGGGILLVFSASEGDLVQPLTGKPQSPTPLDGKAMAIESTADRRGPLADWLVAPENPYFTRSIANRVWANFMGVGLVRGGGRHAQDQPGEQ